MFERALPPHAVRCVIETGEVIASYPDDKPYPSHLMLGFQQDRPIHVLVARDLVTGTCYVVTVYEPKPTMWNNDFKTRRKP